MDGWRINKEKSVWECGCYYAGRWVLRFPDGRRNTPGNELVELESGYFFFK